MISHEHACIFTHIPRTAGKSILALFGLPEFGIEYDGRGDSIADPYDHHPLSEYRDRDYFDQYFKFAIIRNPWDRLVSAFFYLDAGGSNRYDEAFRRQNLLRYGGDFTRFVRDMERLVNAKHFQPQCVWICDTEGYLLADFVGRFETLDRDLETIGNRLNVSPARLPHRNRSEHRSYKEYFTEETRNLVGQLYAMDTKAFGYTFDNGTP